MTTTHRTEISADPVLPVIRIEREFDAPPDRVFRAHTEAELVRQWLGPRRLTMTIQRWDAETGGGYRYTHADGDSADAEVYSFYGSFHEIRADERIVQTFTFDGWPDAVCLETLTLTDLGGGRTRLVAVSMYERVEDRDAMLASGMETGVVEGYEQLDELLA